MENKEKKGRDLRNKERKEKEESCRLSIKERAEEKGKEVEEGEE